MNTTLASALKKNQNTFHAVVPFNSKKDKLLQMNFTATNKELTDTIIEDSGRFAAYINQKIKDADARYGIGGYSEFRSIYSRRDVFDNINGGEPRRLHLGIDVWGRCRNAGICFYGWHGA